MSNYSKYTKQYDDEIDECFGFCDCSNCVHMVQNECEYNNEEDNECEDWEHR